MRFSTSQDVVHGSSIEFRRSAQGPLILNHTEPQSSIEVSRLTSSEEGFGGFRLGTKP